MRRMAEPAAAVVPLAGEGTTHLGIVAGLAMGPAVGLGLGRFAYALLLPAMRADLGWSYAVAGAMNTANAVGYLVGALAAAPIAARIGDKCCLLAGVLLTAASLLATGLATDTVALALLRVVAGAAGALALVTGGALAASAGGGGGRGRPTLALGVYFGGAGFGMVVSAFAVPALVTSVGWRSGWFALGALGLLGAAAALPALARAPSMAARGTWRPPAFTSLATRGLRAVLASYVLFGAGYIAFTTFIVAYLRSRLGFGAAEVTLFWGCAGAAATFAGLAWGPLLARLSGGCGVAAANAVAALGAILPVLLPTHAAVFFAAVLFGGSFLIVPTSVTAFARKAAPPHAWTAAIAMLTAGFAIGQCIGPWLTGEVSDRSYGVAGGLLLSGGILAGAAVIALLQREPRAG
jgi:predicted MFS family arabinose efflux permease